MDGEDLEFTYHGALYEYFTLCEWTPFVLCHLNSKNTNWNETVVRSFEKGVAHHMDTNNSPDTLSYFLTPTILQANEEFEESTGKNKQQPCKSP